MSLRKNVPSRIENVIFIRSCTVCILGFDLLYSDFKTMFKGCFIFTRRNWRKLKNVSFMFGGRSLLNHTLIMN